MVSERRDPLDPQFGGLDAAGTIELCKSLCEYAEASALSRDLMLQVGRYATGRYPEDLDVMLAVARLYQMGGELGRARTTLIEIGKIAPGEARILRLLGQVLAALGSSASPADLIADALRSDPAPSGPPSEPPQVPLRPSQMPTRARVLPTPLSSEVTAVQTISRPTSEGRRNTPPSSKPAPRSAIEGLRGPRSSPRGGRIKLLDRDDPQRFLEPYELIGEIAVGGMASVFLGRLTGAGGFQRFVAIKRLHPHLAREMEFVEMFLDEARLAAGIHHPHVVPILEIGQSEAGYYLVMEFIEGDTLAALISRSSSRGAVLPREIVVKILLDTLGGLHAAHQLKDAEGELLGLVHRDCTPQNILVGSDGSSRITDFGVARASARFATTASQVVKGKVAYLSPEQASAGDLDCRSDLFTMGIVLWEALAGRPLFLADTEAATVSRLVSAPIPSLRAVAPDVPAVLDEVCARALQRDPDKRFPTASAMAVALDFAARSLPNGIASLGEVARCVESLVGAEIAAQQEAVRAWLAQGSDSAPFSRRLVVDGAPLSRRTSPRSRIDELMEPKLPPPPTLPSALELGGAPSSAPRTPRPPEDIVGSATLPSPASEGARPIGDPPASKAVVAPPASEAVVAPPASKKAVVAEPAPALAEPVVARPEPPADARRRWLIVGIIVLVVAGAIWLQQLNQLRQQIGPRPGSEGPPGSSADSPSNAAPR